MPRTLQAAALLAVILLLAAAGFGIDKSRDEPFSMPEVQKPAFQDRDFNVVDFGATPGGKTKNTRAFSRAIQACVDAGGGRVVVPPGKWLSGPIHLESKVNLHLEKGATILFSSDPDDYLPPVFTRWEGVECYNYSALVYANGAENVAITGEGTLDGQGVNWWPWKAKQKEAVRRLYEQGARDVPVKERIFGTKEDALRPSLVQFINCKKVLLEGVTTKDSPFWTNHFVYCENVTVRGITVLAPSWSPNTDGINLDSTRNAAVSGAYISVGDDAVCVKSGRNRDGIRVGVPTRNVLIEKVTVDKAHGGFVVGSETSGGIENVMARGSRYLDSARGVRIKSKRGRGGYVRNVFVEDTVIEKASEKAIEITMNYSFSYGEMSEAVPLFENIRINGLRCGLAGKAAEVVGLADSKIIGLTLSNIEINSARGMNISETGGLTLDNVKVNRALGPAITLENCENAVIRNGTFFTASEYLRVTGPSSANIRVIALDETRAKKAISQGKSTPKEAVIITKP